MLKQGDNTLQFSVSDVGMAFWTTNEYSIENLRITAKIHDTSSTESRNHFYITPDEAKGIINARLRFNPDCKTSEAGYLDVYLNDLTVFSGIPDCGILNTYQISPSVLNVGKNTLKFRTAQGSYLIDQITVTTKLDEPVQPTYYFDLDPDLFYSDTPKQARCGDIDGICPVNCDSNLDRDCCMQEYSTPYWCDAPTEILNDRCVGFMTDAMCSRCPSGYEDRNGRTPDPCKGLCGDDNDGKCPDGCSINYDKDCCYDLSGDQYWCNDLPITGLAFTCVSEVTQNTCRNCPTGYKGERSNPTCDDLITSTEGNEKLRKSYNIIMKFEFTERGSQKEAKIWVNNFETGFDTRESVWMKNINSYVEPNTNSIKIMPRSELEIKEIKVYFD